MCMACKWWNVSEVGNLETNRINSLQRILSDSYSPLMIHKVEHSSADILYTVLFFLNENPSFRSRLHSLFVVVVVVVYYFWLFTKFMNF